MVGFLANRISNSANEDWRHGSIDEFAKSGVIDLSRFNATSEGHFSKKLLDEIARRPNSIVLTHGLGCVWLARSLQEEPDGGIAGALLVSPEIDRAEEDSTSCTIPFAPFLFPAIIAVRREKAHTNAGRIRALARMWDADFVEVGATDTRGARDIDSVPTQEIFLLLQRLKAMVQLNMQPGRIQVSSLLATQNRSSAQYR